MADPFPGERYLSLATFRKSGKEVATPVWYAWESGTLWVFTAGNSGKVKRLRNSSRARVAACDVRGNVRGPWLDAEARIVEDPSEEARAYAALRRKYGWQMRITDLTSRLAGRIRNRKVVAVQLVGSDAGG